MSIQNAFAGSRRLKLDQLMTSLQCPLCSGYLIDAVTIVECSHSFCRSCIVLYVQQSLDNCQCTVGNQKCNCCRCPLPDCTNALSRVNPFKGVHPDPIRQEIVYKLVPNLYQNEMQRRREFYQKHPTPEVGFTEEDHGETTADRVYYTAEDRLSISLEYGTGENQRPISELPSTSSSPLPSCSDTIITNAGFESTQATRRFLLCPASLPIALLKKFLKLKYDLPDNRYQVELMYMQDYLDDELNLVDLAYIYSWRQKEPLRLFYRIRELPSKQKSSSVNQIVLTDVSSSTPPSTYTNKSSSITNQKTALSVKPSTMMANTQASSEKVSSNIQISQAMIQPSMATTPSSNKPSSQVVKQLNTCNPSRSPLIPVSSSSTQTISMSRCPSSSSSLLTPTTASNQSCSPALVSLEGTMRKRKRNTTDQNLATPVSASSMTSNATPSSYFSQTSPQSGIQNRQPSTQQTSIQRSSMSLSQMNGLKHIQTQSGNQNATSINKNNNISNAGNQNSAMKQQTTNEPLRKLRKILPTPPNANTPKRFFTCNQDRQQPEKPQPVQQREAVLHPVTKQQQLPQSTVTSLRNVRVPSTDKRTLISNATIPVSVASTIRSGQNACTNSIEIITNNQPQAPRKTSTTLQQQKHQMEQMVQRQQAIHAMRLNQQKQVNSVLQPASTPKSSHTLSTSNVKSSTQAIQQNQSQNVSASNSGSKQMLTSTNKSQSVTNNNNTLSAKAHLPTQPKMSNNSAAFSMSSILEGTTGNRNNSMTHRPQKSTSVVTINDITITSRASLMPNSSVAAAISPRLTSTQTSCASSSGSSTLVVSNAGLVGVSTPASISIISSINNANSSTSNQASTTITTTTTSPSHTGGHHHHHHHKKHSNGNISDSGSKPSPKSPNSFVITGSEDLHSCVTERGIKILRSALSPGSQNSTQQPNQKNSTSPNNVPATAAVSSTSLDSSTPVKISRLNGQQDVHSAKCSSPTLPSKSPNFAQSPPLKSPTTPSTESSLPPSNGLSAKNSSPAGNKSSASSNVDDDNNNNNGLLVRSNVGERHSPQPPSKQYAKKGASINQIVNKITSSRLGKTVPVSSTTSLPLVGTGDRNSMETSASNTVSNNDNKFSSSTTAITTTTSTANQISLGAAISPTGLASQSTDKPNSSNKSSLSVEKAHGKTSSNAKLDNSSNFPSDINKSKVDPLVIRIAKNTTSRQVFANNTIEVTIDDDGDSGDHLNAKRPNSSATMFTDDNEEDDDDDEGKLVLVINEQSDHSNSGFDEPSLDSSANLARQKSFGRLNSISVSDAPPSSATAPLTINSSLLSAAGNTPPSSSPDFQLKFGRNGCELSRQMKPAHQNAGLGSTANATVFGNTMLVGTVSPPQTPSPKPNEAVPKVNNKQKKKEPNFGALDLTTGGGRKHPLNGGGISGLMAEKQVRAALSMASH